MTMASMKAYGYADQLFGFPRFPDNVREASRFPLKTGCEGSLHVPEIDEAYVFRKDHLRIMQFWAVGAEKNLLLQGETGTGKTSLVEQMASRLNWPVFALGCHGGLEFQELIGRVTLQPDGSTGWADGPLIAAMRIGGIFLLDEMNFLKPEVAGGLNTVLQANVYTIPETGEVVRAHPDFRRDFFVHRGALSVQQRDADAGRAVVLMPGQVVRLCQAGSQRFAQHTGLVGGLGGVRAQVLQHHHKFIAA